MRKIALVFCLGLFALSTTACSPKIERLTCKSYYGDYNGGPMRVVIDHGNKTVSFNGRGYSASMIDDEVHFRGMKIYTYQGERRLYYAQMRSAICK